MNIVVIIIAGRPAPILTLQEHSTTHDVIVLSDPDHIESHRVFVETRGGVRIVPGVKGLSGQVMLAYKVAEKLGYDYFVRLDDDIDRESIIGTNLDGAIDQMLRCALELECSFVGLANTSNPHWLRAANRFVKSVGHIHGGINLARASTKGLNFAKYDTLRLFTDIYQTLMHIEADGFVGRVGRIGFDKSRSVGTQSTMNRSLEVKKKSIAILTKRFPWGVVIRNAATGDLAMAKRADIRRALSAHASAHGAHYERFRQKQGLTKG